MKSDMTVDGMQSAKAPHDQTSTQTEWQSVYSVIDSIVNIVLHYKKERKTHARTNL